MRKSVYYIVYDTTNFKIVQVFEWMQKDILKCLRSNPNLKCINTTHPKAKPALAKINAINQTEY